MRLFVFPLIAVTVCLTATARVSRSEKKIADLEAEISRKEALLDLLVEQLSLPGRSPFEDFARSIDVKSICHGRLTAVSATPFTTSDQTNVATLYFAPYLGTTCSTYVSSAWKLLPFTEPSLDISGITNNKNYDIFGYFSSGTFTLALSAAWTDDTTRADTVTTQDGIPVLQSDTTKRLLGTIRASAAGATEDSLSKRFIWNQQNRLTRKMIRHESAAAWSCTTASWGAANSSNSNRVQYVVGLSTMTTSARVVGQHYNVASVTTGQGIGVDSTTVNSGASGTSSSAAAIREQFINTYSGQPGLGYHFIQWLEFGASNSTCNGTTSGDTDTGLEVEVDG